MTLLPYLLLLHWIFLAGASDSKCQLGLLPGTLVDDQQPGSRYQLLDDECQIANLLQGYSGGEEGLTEEEHGSGSGMHKKLELSSPRRWVQASQQLSLLFLGDSVDCESDMKCVIA